jgi:ABC-type microcin C transport system permease subunit YejB
MATNIAKLKTSGKGAPPAADFAADVIRADERSDDATMMSIQFRVPKSVFAEFSEQAGREFGFNKGSKSQLFLKMWADYMAKK